MMKTGKPALQGATSVDSSLPFSVSPLEGPTSSHCGQAKSKLNRFKIITSILKQGGSTASPRPPEASNGLPNGVLSLVPAEGSEEKLDFPADITDFGSFQKHQQEGGGTGTGPGEVPRQRSSVIEEQPSVSGADGPRRDHRAEKEEDSEGLLEKQTEENSTFNEARHENNELLNTVGSSDDGRKEEREGKSTESFTSSDSVAGGILSEETKDTEI